MKTLNAALKSLVAVAVPFAIVACCPPPKNPDDQLQVEVEEATIATGDEVQTENRCDADVIARAEDGEEVVLEEQARDNSDGSSRCVYTGTVDPNKFYTVEVQREGKLAFVENAESNPACSTETDPLDTDNILVLQEPATRAQLYRERASSPVAERDIKLSR